MICVNVFHAAVIPTSSQPLITSLTSTTPMQNITEVPEERNMAIEGLDSKKASDALVGTGKEFLSEGMRIMQLTFDDVRELSSKYFENLRDLVKPKLEAARDKLCKSNKEKNENKNETAEESDPEEDTESEKDLSIKEFIGFFENNFLTQQLCAYGRQ